MYKKLTEKELGQKRNTPVGELFEAPIVMLTPRNNFRQIFGTNKYNDLVQVSVIQQNIQVRLSTNYNICNLLMNKMLNKIFTIILENSNKDGKVD